MIRASFGSGALCVVLCAVVFGCGDSDDEGSTAPTGHKDAGADAGRDAGPAPIPDAQVPKDAGHDSGPADEDAGSVPCEEAACAASADQCHVGTCNTATNECVLTAKADNTQCGSAADDECTRPDRCMAGTCVPNDVAEGSPCGDVGVDCHVDDSCDGKGQCVDGGLAAANTACGSATDTPCDSPDTCDALGQCLPNYAAVDTVCGDVGVDCHHPDTCNGSGACLDGGLWEVDEFGGFSQCGALNGTSIGGTPYCRCGDQSVNECSNINVCVAGVCSPNDINEGGNCGTVGVCEIERKCNAGSCVPTPKANGFICGSADNDCQVNKQCNGGVCAPVNKSNGAACGSPTNTPPCNLADSCLNGACQANLANNGTSCGDATANRQCDGADSCQAGVCDPNNYGPIVCGAAAGECDLPNRCAAGSCQPDPLLHEPAGTLCGNTSSDACDDADSCNGNGVCNPNPKPAGTSCGDTSTNTACDAPDSCDGAGSCDPNYAAVDAPCGDTLTDTECDGLDGCNGAGNCDAHLAAVGTACGPPASGCTLQDECNGSGQCDDLGVSGSCGGTITGRVVSDETGSPLQGVSVSIYGAPGAPAVTNANGDFSLSAPFYQPVLMVYGSAPGHWGNVNYDAFTEADTSAGERRLLSEGMVSAFVGAIAGAPAADTAKAQAVVSFGGTSGSGGESAVLGATAAGSYTLDGGTWVPSTALIDGDTVLVVNVDAGAGTTSVTVAGNGSNACSVRGGFTTWPVAPKSVLAIEVACQ